jgi:uncharacterized YccA/Bax inhibitor family protein
MAELRSSNPAFRQKFATQTVAPPPDASPEQLATMYRAPSTLTIDDVVIHTLGLFVLLGATAAVGWATAPGSPGVGFAAALAALALSFAIAFGRVIRPPLVVLFALLEGVAIGMISRFYEDAFHGIVLQALLGTGVIFVIMLVL